MKPISRVVLSNTYTMDDKVVIFGDFRADTRNMSYMGHRGFSTSPVPYFPHILTSGVPKVSLIFYRRLSQLKLISSCFTSFNGFFE